MSKLVTTRFEYVSYDDATGVLSPANNAPPTYPAVLDNYCSTSLASTGQGYAAYTISGTGAAVALATPAGAKLTLLAPVANTSLVLLTQTAVALTPGGVAQALVWPVAPGQIVTLPAALNSGTISVQACSTAYVVNATAFSLQVMWSN